MIVGIGVDLVSLSEMAGALERGGGRFVARVCAGASFRGGLPSPGELAVQFACREAAMKALGTGWAAGVGWGDIVVEGRPPSPRLVLRGGALRRAAALGASRSHLSVGGSGSYVIAHVVLER